jgi:acyl-CoA oxidase
MEMAPDVGRTVKHTQVTRDGQVREPQLAQLTYGALLQGRTAMVSDAANVAKKALTIALRCADAPRARHGRD